MIFCGDFVYPFEKEIDIESLPIAFLKEDKLVNLESLIVDENKTRKLAPGVALSSGSGCIKALQKLNVKAVSLANNHICDFDASIDKMKHDLSVNGICSFGAGDSLESAKVPFKFRSEESNYTVLTFGWDVIKCPFADTGKRGVNPMRKENIFEQVKEQISEGNSNKVICIFHTNYEFELYPQPSHREIFKSLIELGVVAIFCHHTHIVGGYEVYRGVPIFYSLGNFYLPDHNFSGFSLVNPEKTKVGVCVEFNGDIDKINLHWVEIKENKLNYIGAEKLVDSIQMKSLSPFSGFTTEQYYRWFKKNRVKSKLLPIYRNFDSTIEVTLNGFIVRWRQKLIDFFVRLGLKRY